jgi:hypothetical protein
MRRDRSHLFPLLSILLLFSSLAYGQAWSGILAPSRAINWGNAGLPTTLPDGETTPNPWTPPTRTLCTTLSPRGSGQDDVPQIINAISACGNGTYVLLAGGTFTIASSMHISPGFTSGHNNVTLRGSGAQSTKLLMGSAGSITVGAASGGGSATLTSGSNYSRGTASITVTGSTPPVNQPAWLNQCDTGRSGSGCTTGSDGDNGGLWICGQQTICSNQTANGGHIHQQQNVFVTAVTGNCSASCTLTITPGLYMGNWAFASSPIISWNDPTYTSIGTGIEDLTVDFTSGTNNYGSFSLNQAYASWVKGVRFIGPSAGSCCQIYVATVNKSLFANNVLYDDNPASGSGGGLTMQHGQDSDFLILNNVFQGSNINEIEGGGQDSGVVLAYNYASDSATSQVYNTDAEHNGSPNFILREGNEFGGSEDDATWGTHNLDTWFRNYYSCWDPSFLGEAAPRGVIIDNWARFENAVGNAIGSSGECTTYQGLGSSPYIFGFGASDSLASSTSMRWGNYDTVTGTVRWNASEVPTSLGANAAFDNPVPGNTNLPPSFFMNGMTAHPDGGTGLSWWQVCTSWTTFPTSCASSRTPPMPPIGPDVTGGNNINGYAYDIPAATAYKTLPIDSTYQNSYTVTGSSWSGGSETLTVSGLPSSNAHIMGGFQLSGAPTACLPTGGVSYTGRPDGEVLMTGSSTTSISYAVASNPGTSCTGTMKWPDIRQFDERVYENDTSGNPPPPAPTGLQATVH